MNTLKAEMRNTEKKAKMLRREGFVTGNVFGRGINKSIPIQIAQKDAERLLKTNKKGSQVILEVGEQSYATLLKEINYNSLKNQIDEIDFQVLVSGEKVHSVAEVVLLNNEKIINGVIQQLLQEIAYKAVPAALVEKVEIDIGAMKAGDTIKVKDLEIASNKDISLVTDPELAVVTVSESHGSAQEAAVPEEPKKE